MRAATACACFGKMSSKSRSASERHSLDDDKHRISHRDFNSGTKEQRLEVIRQV